MSHFRSEVNQYDWASLCAERAGTIKVFRPKSLRLVSALLEMNRLHAEIETLKRRYVLPECPECGNNSFDRVTDECVVHTISQNNLIPTITEDSVLDAFIRCANRECEAAMDADFETRIEEFFT